MTARSNLDQLSSLKGNRGVRDLSYLSNLPYQQKEILNLHLQVKFRHVLINIVTKVGYSEELFKISNMKFISSKPLTSTGLYIRQLWDN